MWWRGRLRERHEVSPVNAGVTVQGVRVGKKYDVKGTLNDLPRRTNETYRNYEIFNTVLCT